MERAHLFKYLFDMSLDEITSFISYDEKVDAAQVAGNARRWWRNSDRLVKTVLTIA